MKIGRIVRVPVRELWHHEEHGFTVWLEENIEVLNEALDLTLTVTDRESRVGPFRADLVAEDEDGQIVIIENQLEPTNHDHLGKVVTYFANLDAKAAIWISTRPRPEHVQAVQWLNESTPADQWFYAVLLEAVSIEQGSAAPLLTVIAGPSEEAKAIGEEKKQIAERHVRRRRFWTSLLERAKEEGVSYHANRRPGKESWIGAGAGKSGLSWNYLIWMRNRSGVELYIDTGEAEENEAIFDSLHGSRQEIESAFGGPLDWERLDGKRACRIRRVQKNPGLQSPEDDWPGIQQEMVNDMGRLVKSISPHLVDL